MKDIGSTLKNFRENLGLTRKEVAEKLAEKGIEISDKTLYGYEAGRTGANADMFLALCQIYGIEDIFSAFGYGGYNDDGSIRLTVTEVEIIEKFRSLDEIGRNAFNFFLDHEMERMKLIKEVTISKKIKQCEQETSASIACYHYYHRIACAGTGFYFDDIPSDTIEAPYMCGADFIIGVNGDSMEPDFHDGDNLYVKRTDHLNVGEVGIFTIGNQCFLKELGENGLVSRNRIYDDIPGSEDVRLIGRVLGKAEGTKKRKN